MSRKGTYPLPEAQLDRFMFQINVDYPVFEEEVQIVKGTTDGSVREVSEILNGQQMLDFSPLSARSLLRTAYLNMPFASWLVHGPKIQMPRIG